MPSNGLTLRSGQRPLAAAEPKRLPFSKKMRKLTLGILLTLIHGALTVFTFVWAYGHTMDYVLDGKPMPKFFYRAMDIMSDVLSFPLVSIALTNGKGWFPGLWGYIPIFLNSALWAAVLVTFFSWGYRTWVFRNGLGGKQ